MSSIAIVNTPGHPPLIQLLEAMGMKSSTRSHEPKFYELFQEKAETDYAARLKATTCTEAQSATRTALFIAWSIDSWLDDYCARHQAGSGRKFDHEIYDAGKRISDRLKRLRIEP